MKAKIYITYKDGIWKYDQVIITPKVNLFLPIAMSTVAIITFTFLESCSDVELLCCFDVLSRTDFGISESF